MFGHDGTIIGNHYVGIYRQSYGVNTKFQYYTRIKNKSGQNTSGEKKRTVSLNASSRK